MDQLIENLKNNEGEYQPNEEVAAQLKLVTMAPIIGPTAVGKSTCMKYVTSMDENFSRVQSFTTRPRRSDDAEDEYLFLPHTQPTLEHITKLVQEGTLVQYAVHPTKHDIYGSQLGAYSSPYMMLDTLASSVAGIRRLPFADVRELTIVTEPEEWEKRFKIRNLSSDEAAKRLREGVMSLEWSLEQDQHMPWVCTTAGTDKLPIVAEEIIGIIKDKRESDPRNRRVGERLLTTLRRLSNL